MQLKKIITISGVIHLVTGLHIGAGKDSIEIGGLDLPIIKNAYTKAPYIPGSSIKGKMRAMLEVMGTGNLAEKQPTINEKGMPCGCGSCMVCTIFGAHSDKQTNPTRILVRDASLTALFKKKFESGTLPMEIKYENTINRIKGIADNPRPVERVPAGVEFDFCLSLKVYADDDEKKHVNLIKRGLQLIELDALGGHSSRGSGQVKFNNLQYKDDNETRSFSLS